MKQDRNSDLSKITRKSNISELETKIAVYKDFEAKYPNFLQKQKDLKDKINDVDQKIRANDFKRTELADLDGDIAKKRANVTQAESDIMLGNLQKAELIRWNVLLEEQLFKVEFLLER